MKKISALIVSVVLICSFVLSSCASSSATKVKRIDPETNVDLSGYWNDTDVRIVAETLINECMNASAISSFKATKGKAPVVILGTFANKSDEHIDTSIIAKKFEIALINSGKVDFVASATERGEVREERADQQINASEDTAKHVGNELGADFMLIGSVKTIVDMAAKSMTRTYYVTAEMINIENNKKLWAGEDHSIKKYITKSSVR